MLPKINRLPSPEIRILMRRGKRTSNNLLELITNTNQLRSSRFAFIVSRSIDKRATKRNRVKRLLRQAVANLLPQIRVNLDVIVVARSKQLLAEEASISGIVDELFHRAHIL